MSRTVNLRSWVEERRAAAGLHLVVDDGDPIVVPPLDLWPDNLGVGDEALLVGIVGGEENVARFRAAGGTVAALLKLLKEPENGGGDPEASEGSSES